MTKSEYIETLRQHYDIVARLSEKNGSEVLRLRHKALNRDIVLRSYPSPIIAYSVLKNIRHKNIVEVYDTFLLDDRFIVLEEFVDGLSVADILKNNHYSYRAAKKVILSLCNALHTLHEFNIIHRDVKPENVIIKSDGTVKLLDFNASRIYSSKKTTDTVVLGTIGYASPEQFGISQSDVKSDIYSLGIMLNVMLTGKHPSEQLASGKASKIVLRCTSIDPNSRFASIEKLSEAL